MVPRLSADSDQERRIGSGASNPHQAQTYLPPWLLKCYQTSRAGIHIRLQQWA